MTVPFLLLIILNLIQNLIIDLISNSGRPETYR